MKKKFFVFSFIIVLLGIFNFGCSPKINNNVGDLVFSVSTENSMAYFGEYLYYSFDISVENNGKNKKRFYAVDFTLEIDGKQYSGISLRGNSNREEKEYFEVDGNSKVLFLVAFSREPDNRYMNFILYQKNYIAQVFGM